MEIVNSGSGEGAVNALKDQSQENSASERDLLESIDTSLKILIKYHQEMMDEIYTKEDLESDDN